MPNHLFPQNRALNEIMWKNMVQPNRPQITIRRMRIACWITKATHTPSGYVIQLLFHYKNVSTNVSQCYVCKYFAYLVLKSLSLNQVKQFIRIT
jgi:hypothetical protein